jgi:hypothetical protein
LQIERVLGDHKGVALCVFLGILLAELLAPRVSPAVAWFLGGALMGSAPVRPGPSHPYGRVAWRMLISGAAAALAHALSAGW